MERISRRTLLKGLGTAVALPWLEGMAPLTALGSSPPKPPLRPRARLSCSGMGCSSEHLRNAV